MSRVQFPSYCAERGPRPPFACLASTPHPRPVRLGELSPSVQMIGDSTNLVPPERPLRSPLGRGDLLFLLHIPRTAGTSLFEVLRRQFSIREVFWDPFEEVGEKLKAGVPERVARIRLARAHGGYGIYRFLPRKPVYVTSLRDPIQRVLSLHGHICQTPTHVDHAGLREQGMTLEAFLSWPKMQRQVRNAQVMAIAGWEVAGGRPLSPTENLELAKIRLEEFATFALADRLLESVELIHHVFGWSPAGPLPRRNVRKDSLDIDAIPQADRETLFQLTELDRELYRYASRLFEERFRQMKQEKDGRSGTRPVYSPRAVRGPRAAPVERRMPALLRRIQLRMFSARSIPYRVVLSVQSRMQPRHLGRRPDVSARSVRVPLASDDVLFLWEIPGTGGERLEAFLKGLFKPREILALPPADAASVLASLPKDEWARVRLVRGDFPFAAFGRFASQYLRANPMLLVMIRAPVRLELSTSDGLANRQTLALGASRLPTEHSASFSRARDGEVSDEVLMVLAKEGLEQAAFFGLAERFEESLELLEYTFGWKTVRRVPSPARPNHVWSGKGAPEAVRAELRARNSLDVELYGFALSLFERRLAAMRAEVAANRGIFRHRR